MIEVTTPRALLDWYKTDRSRGRGRPKDDDDQPVPLPGVIGMTAYRLRFKMHRRVAEKVVELCDEALADETLHESKRNAIEVTRKQIAGAMAAENGDEL